MVKFDIQNNNKIIILEDLINPTIIRENNKYDDKLEILP